MRLSTVGLTLLLSVTPGAIARGQAPGTASALTGLRAIRVNVDLKMPAGVLSRTDTMALGNRVSDELTQHGWTLRPLNDATERDTPLLFIGVLVAEGWVSGAPVYGIRLECTLTESVRRMRDGAVIAGSTWSSGGQLILVTNPAELPAAILNGAVAVAAKFNRDRGVIAPAVRK